MPVISNILIKNSIPKLTSSSIISYELFMDNNQQISSVSRIRDIQENTIISHLLPIIAADIDENSIELDDLINPKKCMKICDYLNHYPNCELLREIFLAFEGDISYSEIRLSIAIYIRHNKSIDKSFIINSYKICNTKYVQDEISRLVKKVKKEKKINRYSSYYDYYEDYYDNGYDSWSYEDSLAEACDGDYDAMMELYDRG